LGWPVWYHDYTPSSIRDYFSQRLQNQQKGRKGPEKTARPTITSKGVDRDSFRIREPGEKSFKFGVATRREEVYFGKSEVRDHLVERPVG